METDTQHGGTVRDSFELVKIGDLDKLSEAFEAGECQDIKKRDKFGRNLLELAALLGKCDIVEFLVHKSGLDINGSNSTGYTALHLGAVWGHKECIKVLVSLGADFKLVTKRKETAKDLAKRYGHSKCVNLLECTEAKFQLKQAIAQARETLTDSEKLSGKWNKEDKSKVTALCNEKTEWIDKDNDSQYSQEEILSQLKDFEERYQPHLSKLIHV